jgi:hypothetical protein
MLKPILAISLGAALGAVLRWMLGTKLNSLFPAIPPGTLNRPGFCRHLGALNFRQPRRCHEQQALPG